MNELIPINYDGEQPTVSARELHKSLEISKRFSAWFETNSQGFIENEDYTSVLTGTEVQNNGGVQIRELQDYSLSVDMAKHICLMSRTEKGKECRQYLIDLEKAWNTPEQVFARALKMADQTIAKLKDTNKSLAEKIEADRPKTIFADAVSASHTSILIGDLAKLICQNGYQIGQKRLFQWMRDNGYLMVSGSSRNMPKQKYVEQGLFEIKESNVQNPDGSVRITRTTKVSGKGQLYFVNKFLGQETEKADGD
jgi:anti-repressor protein|nr:MAG TPA: KilAC domain protein [Caudoviricetes sp.]